MIPKSKVLVTSTDPLQLLRAEVKDITKIQPLALRGEITTWQYDAKNCIALHYRMVDNDVWSRELFEAIQKWVARLLIYASALGFDARYPGSLCKGRPSVLQGYWYLTQELRRIKLLSWSDQNIRDFRIERRVDRDMLKTLGKGRERCVLHHDTLCGYDFGVQYRCTVDGSVRLSMGWCGSTSLKRLVAKINRAVKKHRNPVYRETILEKMRSKKYGERKLRPGFRKA